MNRASNMHDRKRKAESPSNRYKGEDLQGPYPAIGASYYVGRCAIEYDRNWLDAWLTRSCIVSSRGACTS